ncbi:unnamed protein product [Urochloa decumbens]|uniref:Uncharacterized protein n=1 Tax=Urochloa decumbens TaxID=240449 RepID=A0ABC8XKA3_9POAL
MASKDENEFPFKSADKIEDSTERAKDSKLFFGKCFTNMKVPSESSEEYCFTDEYSVPIMIKKGSEIKKETYDLIRDFQHNTLVPNLNFYPESNHGRVVIPILGASFETWFHEKNNWKLLIGEDGSMTRLFDTMIIDICDLVEKLYGNLILIKNLDWNNLYMAEEIAPRVVVLVTEAESFAHEPSKIAIWKPVHEIVERCYKECNIRMSNEVCRYISFIGTTHFTVKSLKGYPLNWDSYTKGEYILSLISASKKSITKRMGKTGVSWPYRDGKLPVLLNELVEHNTDNGWDYLTSVRFDYINLIRNTYKHFNKLPQYFKQSFGGEQGFIRVVEQWSPNIWQDLYDEIGWP